MDLSSATRNNSVSNYVCVCEFEVLMLTVRKVLAAGVGPAPHSNVVSARSRTQSL